VYLLREQKAICKYIEMIENKYAKFNYFKRVFTGIGKWSFESINGKTKARFPWNVII
jgi:hypothetical protein